MVRFGKLDGPVFMTPNAGLAISVFSHEDVKCGFWMRMCLLDEIVACFSRSSSIGQFLDLILGLDHPRWPLFSYDNLFVLGRLGLSAEPRPSLH
jgi:hypothetical protein